LTWLIRHTTEPVGLARLPSFHLTRSTAWEATWLASLAGAVRRACTEKATNPAIPYAKIVALAAKRVKPEGGHAVCGELLDRYYALHGEDEATGMPLHSTLEQLGLMDICGNLAAEG
jgi:hypothetical protein